MISGKNDTNYIEKSDRSNRKSNRKVVFCKKWTMFDRDVDYMYHKKMVSYGNRKLFTGYRRQFMVLL